MSITIRDAETTDREEVQTVARRSLETSYSLSPASIDAAVESWYDEDAFAASLDRSDATILVAERDDEVAGFAESEVTDGNDGDVRWLHIGPAHRGRGIGSRLFERTRDELEASGVDRLRGKVLARNAEGRTFYAQRGFRKVANSQIEIDTRRYVETVYAKDWTAGLRPLTTPDGRDVYVDVEDPDPGSNAPVHPVYSDSDRESQFGAFCANCDSLANAMNSMGRIECPECGNVRAAKEWDASYL